MLGAVLVGILYFGLGHQSVWFPNGVGWISGQPGIRFSGYGIAFTNPYLEMNPGGRDAARGFTVEIAMAPEILDNNAFSFVWVLDSGTDSDQLVMGQYRSWFIIMNGDDYDHSRKIKRITANIDSLPRGKRFVTITSGPEGSRIYFDGRLVKKTKDLTLKIPTNKKVRLVIGNSAKGKHSWRGDIYGFALYRYPLIDSEVAHHFDRWSKNQNFYFAETGAPSLLYIFDEMSGPRASDHAGGSRHLHIPSRAKVLERQFLAPPRGGMDPAKLNVMDVVINFVGFIPFGFILSATLSKRGGMFRKYGIFLAVGACFTVSLVIEIVQAWIPLRSSDLLDLVFNTSGGLVGAVIYLTISGRIGAPYDP